MKDELDRFAREDLIRIHHDMSVIREFETMLNEVKTRPATRASNTRTRAPPTSQSGRSLGRRTGVRWAWMTTFFGATAATARSWPGALGHRQA